MNALSEPGINKIVFMTSSQVGKTEILLNIIGYYISQDPAPILVMQPTLEIAETFSKDRLSTMLRDTPCLMGLVADPRARDSGNTVLHKTFLGGHVTAVGANSPAGLASRPIRVLLADEVDRYPISAGTEGDPLSLAIKRTATFWNRRVILASTPTVKGASRIESEYLRSDQRKYFCVCIHCQHKQVMTWGNVKWPDGQPQEAQYCCEECGTLWTEADRRKAIRWGEWRATAKANGFAGFHLSELYSPWSSIADMAIAFVNAKRSSETLKTWVNTSLGESWEEDAERIDSHTIASRMEKWDENGVPNKILAITCGADVQDDRIEIERVGWGVEEESWSLEHKVLFGDPSTPELWKQLDEYLLSTSIRRDGIILPVEATCIDSGGHYTQAVYKFCRDRFRRRVYAIKGKGGPGNPVWPKRASKNNSGRVNLFFVGVDAAKDIIYSRLKIAEHGPGCCHFPVGRDRAYFDQLTSEIVQTKYTKGFATRVYVLPSGKRNEALDIRVYAYAALQSLNIRWGHLLARQGSKQIEEEPKIETQPIRVEQTEQAELPPQMPPPQIGRNKFFRRARRSGFMNG